MHKLVLIAAGAAAFSGAAQAVPILDQSNVATAPVGGQVVADTTGGHVELPATSGNFYDITRAQSVTAGVTGTLSGVDLELTRFGAQNVAGGGELTIATNVVLNQDGTVASAAVLGNFGFDISSLATNPTGGLVHFDVSALNLFLNAGDVFWLAVGPTTAGVFGWVSGTAPTIPPNSNTTFLQYSGGQGLASFVVSGSGGSNHFNDVGHDYGFRTWMETGAVPEPATWAMMIGGFALAGAMMRRSRPAGAASAI